MEDDAVTYIVVDGGAARAAPLLLKWTVNQIGCRHLPTLYGMLPQCNGGSFPVEQVQAALQEIQTFSEKIGDVLSPVMMDSHTGHTIYYYLHSHHGVFAWHGNSMYGFNENGFFIKNRDGAELFQSKRVKLIQKNLLQQSSKFFFVGIDNRSKFISPDWDMKDTLPEMFHVETRRLTQGDFSDILNALTQLLHASIETGNPIVWA